MIPRTLPPNAEGVRPPLACPRCGSAMNRHASKIVAPTAVEDRARVDVALGGVLEEHHLCPNCGFVECLPVVP
jgi:ribosomal protein S27AE